MRCIWVFIIQFCAISLCWADNPKVAWVTTFGGGFDCETNASAIDSKGNIYIVGNFKGNLEYAITNKKELLSSKGDRDILIAKFNSVGEVLWVKQIGGVLSDQAFAITIDFKNNLVIGGQFRESCDFDPNAGNFKVTAKNFWDIFTLKLTDNGDFIWVKTFEGNGTGNIIGLVTDKKGNIYSTGHYTDVYDFDPGASVYNITSLGFTDIFICKLNMDGNLIWTRTIGGGGGHLSKGIALDKAENIWVTGNIFDTSSVLAGDVKIATINNYKSGVLVGKFDKNGNPLFLNSYPCEDGNGTSIQFDNTGAAYITGYFRGFIKFGDANNSNDFKSKSDGGYLLKVKSSGKFQWVTIFGDLGIGASCSQLAIDKSGNSYAIGTFWGGGNFDGIQKNKYVVSTGLTSIYISKIDKFGKINWVEYFGGSEWFKGRSVFLNNKNQIILVGNGDNFKTLMGSDAINLLKNGEKAGICIISMDLKN